MKAAGLVFASASCLGVAAVAAISLVPHSRTTEPHRYAGMSMPEASVFERACKDCHSNDTEWPWYSKIPPVSLGVVADVRRGRKTWNISEWGTYSKGKKLGFLTAIATDAANDNMPPRAYRWMHRDSVLKDSDRVLLAGWANAEKARIRSSNASAPQHVAADNRVVSR